MFFLPQVVAAEQSRYFFQPLARTSGALPHCGMALFPEIHPLPCGDLGSDTVLRAGSPTVTRRPTELVAAFAAITTVIAVLVTTLPPLHW